MEVFGSGVAVGYKRRNLALLRAPEAAPVNGKSKARTVRDAYRETRRGARRATGNRCFWFWYIHRVAHYSVKECQITKKRIEISILVLFVSTFCTTRQKNQSLDLGWLKSWRGMVIK